VFSRHAGAGRGAAPWPEEIAVTSVILRAATLAAVLALGATSGAHVRSDPVQSPGLQPFMIKGLFDPEGGGRVITGHPYSAQTVTEMTQTLADGNRIVQRMEGAVYRDREGRTRREHTFTGIGPLPRGTAIQGRQVITINDVVTGRRYVLDPQAKTARPMQRWRRREDGAATRPGGPPVDRIERSADAPGGHPPVRESLGTKTIEGLEVEGTRTTITIPAGEAGNDMPIEIVSERWFSKELQVPVTMRFVDPRVGERVYRLTSIVRGEPSPQLFMVPADFTTLDALERPMRAKRVP
jgi:hypothetical protein